jgi:sugar lactone lactonase YvrE
MQTILELGAARVFYDGILAEPRLDHQKGLAVHRDGSVWCGGERGQIYRIEADGSSIEQAASSAGFSHGMAFDADDNLYVCDSYAFKESGPGIFRFDPDGSGELWYDEPINFANGLALSPDGDHLYVAETFANAIFRIPIEEDGSAGAHEEVTHLPGVLPEGWPSIPKAICTSPATNRARCSASPPTGRLCA